MTEENSCITCGSDQIEGTGQEITSGEIWQRMGCNQCDGEWFDVYTLARTVCAGKLYWQ